MDALAVTGHRPDKLGGYEAKATLRLRRFAVEEMRRAEPDSVLTGMALGWDLAIALACFQLGIPYVACVPCDAQDSRWTPYWQAEYQQLLLHAGEIVIVSPGPYAGWKMQARNRYMADRANQSLALWNGTEGGTANYVKYAKQTGKPIENCWDRWQEFLLFT